MNFAGCLKSADWVGSDAANACAFNGVFSLKK